MSLDHILLGLLREPATGYDLKRVFAERIRHFWSAELSQIYPTLKRLERRRMLRSRVEPSTKGPHRKVYALTDEGREELARWLRGGPAVGAERFAYLAQLYFMDAIGDLRATRAFMTELRDHLADRLARLESLEREVVAEYGDPARYGDAGLHRFATLRMGIRSIGSKVAWCDDTLVAIDQRLAWAAGGGAAASAREEGAGGRAAGDGTTAVGDQRETRGGTAAVAGDLEAESHAKAGVDDRETLSGAQAAVDGRAAGDVQRGTTAGEPESVPVEREGRP